MVVEPVDRTVGSHEQKVFFDFESDFVTTLRCIPMIVRFKLDLCGVKLTLKAWSRFDHAMRAQCVNLPTASEHDIAAYGQAVLRAIERVELHPIMLAVDPSPPWMNTHCIPPAVLKKGQEAGVSLERFARWRDLAPLQRFALLKLTRGGHENENFLPALKEFGLI